MRTSTQYNKIVNIAEDGEITVLNDVFSYSDNHKGARGSKFYPVSEKEYNQRTTIKSIEEFLSSSVALEDVPSKYLYTNIGRERKNPFKCWAMAIINEGEVDNVMFDTSYSSIWDDLREQANLSQEEAVIFDCVGGGRCFDKNFQGNITPELSEIIREYES